MRFETDETVRPEAPSASNAEELSQLRERIIAGARRTVDPRGTGMNPVMLTDDESGFFSTDDVAFKDWWDWVEQVIRTISDGLTRVALGLTGAGLAIAASHMYGTPDGSRYANFTLGAAGLMVGWLLVSTGSSMRRK